MSNALFVALAKSVADLREAFTALSRQPGPAGQDGKDGRDGADGKDGVGQPGKNGRNGKDGVGQPGKNGRDGKDGTNGVDGKDGAEGPVGPMPKHQWRGTELRFQLTAKKWGQWVDLKGPAGPPGRVVVAGGGDGGTPLNPKDIELVTGVQSGDEMLMVRGDKFVRVKIALSGVPLNAITVDGQHVTVNGEYVVVSE